MLCKTYRLYVALGSLLGFVLIGCQKPNQKPAAIPLKIATVQAVSKQITDYDEYVGRTGAIETVEVRARVTVTSSKSISATAKPSRKTICFFRSNPMYTKLHISKRLPKSI
jgi:hypothetical protein